MQPDDVTVRAFLPEEWELFKAVRLKALKSDPTVFSSSYDKEAAYPDTRWQESLSNPDVGVFGVFHGGDIIGMTGIALREKETGKAVLWGSWIEKHWRGRGLSRKMYAARIDWARGNSGVSHIVVSHRKSNAASRAANQKHGFVWTHDVEDFVWPDGACEPECFYELKVR